MTSDELIAFARHHRVLDFELGEIDCERDDSVTLLRELANLRREFGYSFTFSSRILSPVNRRHATLLSCAGVKRVELGFRAVRLPAIGWSLGRSFLTLVQSVKLLHEVGIEIDWYLPIIDADSRLYGQLSSAVAATYHLPPPAGITCQCGARIPAFAPEPSASCRCGIPPSAQLSTLLQVITTWQERFAPKVLTYARGPGFVRVRDRRQYDNGDVFRVLREPEVTILLTADEVRSFAELTDAVPRIPAVVLKNTLAQLTDQRLMCSMGDAYFLALPVRRSFSEQWLSLEH